MVGGASWKVMSQSQDYNAYNNSSPKPTNRQVAMVLGHQAITSKQAIEEYQKLIFSPPRLWAFQDF